MTSIAEDQTLTVLHSSRCPPPPLMVLLSSLFWVSSNVRMRKAINHLKKSDPVMRSIIERVGPCRMEFGEPVFHSLAEAIVYQQLNGKAAETIFKRFAALAGEPLSRRKEL